MFEQSTNVASQPKISQIGPYQIIEELGRGAMGVVFRGFDPGISRPVAVKVIRPQHSSPDQAAEARMRFSREAKAAGRLSHPNIVTIYQIGEDRGYSYMSMEYVEGAPLSSMMSPGVSMPEDKVLGMVRQVSEALDHAHQQEVVHRDIKPSNILVRTDGKVKIADFGIARIASQTLTQQGMTLGTPAYMSPEQIQGAKVDGKADQFSLAVLAYQMLAGQKPFEASTEQALILSIVSDPPKPIHQANPNLPSSASAVFERALAKDPANRYGTCAEFCAALIEGLKPAPAPVMPQVVAAARRPMRIKGMLAPLALAVVAAGLGAYLFMQQSGGRNTRETPATHPSIAATPVVAPQPVGRAPVKHPAKAHPRTSETEAGKVPSDTAPASPADAQAPREQRQQIKQLQAKRQQAAAELDQAQKELDDLRLRYKDDYPEVQAAISHVDTLRKSLEEIDDNLAALKSAR